MTGNGAGLFIDHAFIILEFILPIWAVLRLRLFGLIAGAALVWILGMLSFIIHMIDSSDDKFSYAIVSFEWLIFGWIFCLAYSALIYMVILPFYKKSRTKPLDDEQATESSETLQNWRYIFRHLHPVERIVLAVVIGFHLFMLYVGSFR